MRSLSSTLEAAQKSRSASPHPRVEVFRKLGGITRLAWERLYEGEEPDGYNAAAMPSDGSLIRFRVDPADTKGYYQRVTSPDENSDYTSWALWALTIYGNPAICAYGSAVFLFLISQIDDKLYRRESSDSGATWGSWQDMGNPGPDADFRLAACFKSAAEAIVLYTDGTTLYRRRLSGGSWEGAAAWTNTLNSITGIAVTYLGDWNIVVTGTEETTEKPGVWTCLLGDGYSAAVDSWTSLKELAIAEADSEISFHFPALDTPDVFRTFLIEAYAGSEPYNRPYWTHSLPTADFIDNLWREPVPFNPSSDYGLALCHKSPHAWLTRPDGVWRAVLSPDSVELTSDVLHLTALARETSGEISVTLRNDDGRYAIPGVGDNAPVKFGSEIKFSPGYRSSEGIEVSAGPAYWITGWEYISQGSKAAFILHAADGWGLLERWKARRQFTWQAGDRNIFQILSWVFARAGLEFSALGSSSSAITDLEPAFTIMPGESGKTAVLRLLSMVEEVLFFRGNYGYLRYPQDSDTTDYEYGTDHSILEGEYGQQAKAINRAQVFGDEVFTEDWDWPEIELVLDILGQAQDLNLDTEARAHARGQAMLRDAEIHAGAGQITVPLNCGQEIYDVVEITDQRAGLSAAKRRVLALQHTYAPSKGTYVLRIALGAV